MAPILPSFNLFDVVQSVTLRLQSNVNQRLNLFSTYLVTQSSVEAPFDQVTVSSSCSFQSTFVQCLQNDMQVVSKQIRDLLDSNASFHHQLLSIDGVALLIVSFLDGESLSRVQGVNTAYYTFIQHNHELLYQSLVNERQVFQTVIASSLAFKSYLFSLRCELDRELGHMHAVQPIHKALEQYCRSTNEHGFVAMFCDIVEFRDPRIARFVAWKRQSALNIVLAATPDHVINFRKRSSDIGPITFVPIVNPLWPVFTSSRVDAPGFMGYAFDHVTMVKGYEALKDTVVKSILKELMIFDTTANAAAYGRSIGQAPYAAVLDDEDAWVQAEQTEKTSHVSFSSHLRQQLAMHPIDERIRRLRSKIKAVDNRIAAI